MALETKNAKNGTEAFKMIHDFLGKEISFDNVSKVFNREDVFTFTVDGDIFISAICTPDNSRIEAIEIINTKENGSARKPFTVYIKPATNETKAEPKMTQTAKFEAGKTYFVNWNEDTGRQHTARYTIEKRTAKTVVIKGSRSKVSYCDWANCEVAKVSYGTYIYAKDVYGEEAIKRQAEQDAFWDAEEIKIEQRAIEIKREHAMLEAVVSPEAQDVAIYEEEKSALLEFVEEKYGKDWAINRTNAIKSMFSKESEPRGIDYEQNLKSVENAEVEDYVVSVEAQEVAIEAEINNAAAEHIKEQYEGLKEQIKFMTRNYPELTAANVETLYVAGTLGYTHEQTIELIQSFLDDYNARVALEAKKIYEKAMLETVISEEAMEVAIEAETELASVETKAEITEIEVKKFEVGKWYVSNEERYFLDKGELVYEPADCRYLILKRTKKMVTIYDYQNDDWNYLEDYNPDDEVPGEFDCISRKRIQYNENGEYVYWYDSDSELVLLRAKDETSKPTNDDAPEEVAENEADVEEYEVSVEAQDAAVEAETEEDFATKLAELKAKAEKAKKAAEYARVECNRAEVAYDKAHNLYHQAKLNVYNAEDAIDQLLATEAEKLRDNLLDDEIFLAKIAIITQSGKSFNEAKLGDICINFSPEGFTLKITADCEHYGEYETPAQVETVINQLKAAIERGDKEFKFPTVDELNNPPIDTELDGSEEDVDDSEHAPKETDYKPDDEFTDKTEIGRLEKRMHDIVKKRKEIYDALDDVKGSDEITQDWIDYLEAELQSLHTEYGECWTRLEELQNIA